MAETKKTAVAKPTAKAVAAKAVDTKAEEVKTETAAKAAPKAETKKTTAKKTTKAAAKKTAAKETAKETTKTAGRKAAAKAVVHLQFSGKERTTEELVQSAKDIWKYDLNRNPEDFKSVELYVKPEENKVYYVINGEVNGAFDI